MVWYSGGDVTHVFIATDPFWLLYGLPTIEAGILIDKIEVAFGGGAIKDLQAMEVHGKYYLNDATLSNDYFIEISLSKRNYRNLYTSCRSAGEGEVVDDLKSKTGCGSRKLEVYSALHSGLLVGYRDELRKLGDGFYISAALGIQNVRTTPKLKNHESIANPFFFSSEGTYPILDISIGYLF